MEWGYESPRPTVLMETSCELAALRVKNLLCAKSESPRWFFYSLLGFCDSSSRSQLLAAAIAALPPFSVQSISNPEGEYSLKTNNNKTKDQSGARSAEGELL